MQNKEDYEILKIKNIIEPYNLFCCYYWLKKVMKQPIDLKNIKIIESCLNKLWLNFVLSEFFYTNKFEWCINNHWFKMIYIWKNIDEIGQCKKYDEEFIDDFHFYDWWREYVYDKEKYQNAIIWMWRLLWYPKCCIERHIETINSDDKLFDIYNFNVVDYKNCSVYLNYFEYSCLHHVPCSFSCVNSITLVKKSLKYFLLCFEENNIENILKNIVEKKIIILFKNLSFIKICQWKIFFNERVHNNIDSKIFYNIKTYILENGFEIKDIDNLEKNKIILTNWTNEMIFENLLVMYFK